MNGYPRCDRHPEGAEPLRGYALSLPKNPHKHTGIHIFPLISCDFEVFGRGASKLSPHIHLAGPLR